MLLLFLLATGLVLFILCVPNVLIFVEKDFGPDGSPRQLLSIILTHELRPLGLLPLVVDVAVAREENGESADKIVCVPLELFIMERSVRMNSF